MTEFAGKRVTVAGLGRFGGNIAAARWLTARGASVRVTDEAPAAKLADSIEQLRDVPALQFHLGGFRVDDFTSADFVVASPAIPPNHSALAAAESAGVPVTTEIRLFLERCPARVVGVTGTKGKSTTSTLLHHMLATRHRTFLGGNIGGSLLPSLSEMGRDDLVVLELSSYMLHYLGRARWSPSVAVVTMLSSDHLEWHGSADAYLAAKANLVRFQRPGDVAVLNRDDAASMRLNSQTAARRVTFGVDDQPPFALRLPGAHNQLNAQAAFAAAARLGVDRAAAQAAIADFTGLPHRLQLVAERDGVRYFNDSIATIPQAAQAALAAFPPKTVIQIVGGSDKGLDIAAMATALGERAKAVLCIGATGPRVAASIDGHANVQDCGDLPTALAAARAIASPGEVILLSPGFASYDQFVNFEQRGEMFTRLATAPG